MENSKNNWHLTLYNSQPSKVWVPFTAFFPNINFHSKLFNSCSWGFPFQSHRFFCTQCPWSESSTLAIGLRTRPCWNAFTHNWYWWTAYGSRFLPWCVCVCVPAHPVPLIIHTLSAGALVETLGSRCCCCCCWWLWQICIAFSDETIPWLAIFEMFYMLKIYWSWD